MSDYIYGNSLSAAKSKVNYLFKGDFRRRPNQNLSGASRSVARVELLQQAAEQRQTREDTRRKEHASLKIQSVWRAYRCRQLLAISMRLKFDDLTRRIQESRKSSTRFTIEHFQQLSREFIIFYHSRHDAERFNRLIDLMMENRKVVLESKTSDPRRWLYIISRLLSLNLAVIEKHASNIVETRFLGFLEYFTRPGEVLDKTDEYFVWQSLIKCRFYSVIRQLVEKIIIGLNDASPSHEPRNELYLELIRRSLDSDHDGHERTIARLNITYCFFEQFLCRPLHPILEDYYLQKLLDQSPKQLKPKHILTAFKNSSRLQASSLTSQHSTMNLNHTGQKSIDECRDITWLCFLFVKTLHARTNDFNDSEKVSYINIISTYIAPAEYITNISAIITANETADEQMADDDDVSGLVETSARVSRSGHDQDTHALIKKLIGLLNQMDHIDSLKSVIFSEQHQPQVQDAIVKICNLMLSHEYLAIFNCRLLYTVAFSKEFSRSLWRSITTTATSSLYGNNMPIYTLISRGSQTINSDSWKSILPKLRLFCSLCSYLLPTLGDDEFYTNGNNPLYSAEDQRNTNNMESEDASKDGNNGPNRRHHGSSSSSGGRESNSTIGSFYIDRELVGISAILRDICVGMVEILYQSNRQAVNQRHHNRFLPSSEIGHNRAITSLQAEQTGVLTYEIKSCFQAVVRLVCQLHARDSRKQFCPDGHWICPTVIVPANKAIDFQLVTSQKGRLLNQMTRDDQTLDRLASASSEIKTVLILQEIPFVISFHDRVQIFHQLLRKERQIHQSDGYHFGLPGTAISVQIRRNYLYEDAFEKLSFDNEPNMKLPLKVSLVNAVGADEAGIDGGGLTKEFLDELLKAGFDPMRGFFKYTKDHFLYPNPSANVLFSTLHEGYEVHYEFLGRMLGKAIFEKIMVELPLASFFLAKLLAVKHSSDVDLHNLESLDPVLYKNLVYLKNYKGDVADLNLDFTISNNELDEHEVVELKPGGSKIPVTRENKIEYVHLVADYRLNKQIRLQCAAFKRGLAQLVDLDWLRMFDPRELQILISGAPTKIDVSDWRRHTIYGNGYSATSEAIQTFWTVVGQFDESQKRKLLKFVTSCSLPPLLGFKDLVPQFAIAPAEEGRLPTASTCMNLLKLPQYEDEQTMHSKLLYAIESNSGFELS
uniref:HECT-type E3 ubiquitin transferase n=1 Tax=Aceria tosichella TaxID=561515 RepID=A0A6G1SPZ7_9ACAR